MEIECPGQAGEIYKKLKTSLQNYQQQGKLAQIKELNFDDNANSALATGTGFKGELQCRDGKVVLNLDLNFMLKPMRGQIEEQLRKMISRIFA